MGIKAEQIYKIKAYSTANCLITLAKLSVNNIKYVVSSGSDGNGPILKVWNAENGDFISEYKLTFLSEIVGKYEYLSIKAITSYYSPFDNRCFVFIGGVDQYSEVYLYRFQLDISGNLINKKKFDSLVGGIFSIIANDKYLAVYGRHTINIYDPINLIPLKHLGNIEMEGDITFTEDENIILHSDCDLHSKNRITAWDIEMGRELFYLYDPAYKLSYSKIKKLLASSSTFFLDGKDYKIKIWDIETRKYLLTIEFESFIDNLVFSNDGNYLFIIIDDIIKVFSTDSFKLIYEYKEHSKCPKNRINSLELGENNEVFSSSDDGNIHKWH